jgi:hypothetical protein
MLLEHATLPARLDSVEALDELLARPSEALVRDLGQIDGDLMILGVGGKMGPTLARLARNAAPGKRIIAVARFSTPGLQQELERADIETVTADLLDRESVRALPQAPNIIFMAGYKFGAGDNPALTWAMNVHLPALVAEHFSQSRIVAFSTGCVYPFVPVSQGGATEATQPDPPGEYAMTCIGRERMFQHFSALHSTPGRLFRLNYAIDLRYGVLYDIARKVRDAVPLDLTMGHVNVIWQGDAATQALRCLRHCTSPTAPLNVSGPETLSVRWLAAELGRRLDRTPVLTGTEATECWLTNTAEAARLFGYPVVPLASMLDWVAEWVAQDRPSLGKPTKFELRSGVY